ncbi:MAG: LamB/YcsF family protein [Syntrophaceae bacterium PtaU1.Bin231]|nr:MAG: LamB/YcsF family protein [Syntrophaceae bacterium PtaU1.Bin231]
MNSIDINCDMGESFGAYTIGMDGEVLRYISSANIACGYHAGDPRVMNRTVKAAGENGVGVGAHPGFPDLVGFGRRNMDCTPDEVRDDVIYQVAALKGFCSLHGVKMQHVKPHGSLYNMCVGNEALSRAVAEAIAAVDPTLLWVYLGGASAAQAQKVAREAGIRVVFEAFPDRAYTPDGKLASRKLPGAVIEDPAKAAEQALRMARDGRVIALDGTPLDMEIHTLCVHGDNPSALHHVRTIRQALAAEGISIVSLGKAV